MFNVHAFIIISCVCVTQERHINQIDEIGNRLLIHQHLDPGSVRQLFGTHSKKFTYQIIHESRICSYGCELVPFQNYKLIECKFMSLLIFVFRFVFFLQVSQRHSIRYLAKGSTHEPQHSLWLFVGLRCCTHVACANKRGIL